MIGGGVSAKEDIEGGVLEVLEANGSRAGADTGGQCDGAGVMTVERTVVDIVRSEQAGHELQRKAGLIRRAAAGVKETPRGTGRFQSLGDALQRVVPRRHVVVSVIGAGIKGRDEPAALFQLSRGQGP